MTYLWTWRKCYKGYIVYANVIYGPSSSSRTNIRRWQRNGWFILALPVYCRSKLPRLITMHFKQQTLSGHTRHEESKGYPFANRGQNVMYRNAIEAEQLFGDSLYLRGGSDRKTSGKYKSLAISRPHSNPLVESLKASRVDTSWWEQYRVDWYIMSANT